MELQILISKKGTKVVTASNLHEALQLLDHHFQANVKKWLQDVYEFRDGIRRPIQMQDYAPRKLKGVGVIEDYFLSVELARHIALRSNSKVKLKYARYLQSSAEEEEPAMLKPEQLLELPALINKMCSIAYQEHCEQQHLETYKQRNGGNASHWWRHRAEVLGYSAEQLREKALQLGKNVNGKSHRQLLMLTDKYELIRAGVIDLFMATGKSERYARTLGDLAKSLAKAMQIEMYDDRETGNLFVPAASAEPETRYELKKLEPAFRRSA